jgi:hypothetical protein
MRRTRRNLISNKSDISQIGELAAWDIYNSGEHFQIGKLNDSMEMALWREGWKVLRAWSDNFAIAWDPANLVGYVVHGDVPNKGTIAAPINPDADMSEAGVLMRQAEKTENPKRRRTRRTNPAAERELYESFTGKRARKNSDVTAPTGTPSHVAKLGDLRLIQTTDGRKWKFSGPHAPVLAADRKQKLHVVGGRYRANPAGESCGEIDRIEYEASKPHLGHAKRSIYYHQLGEDTGERPTLRIDQDGLIRIEGGAYWIESDGIHN